MLRTEITYYRFPGPAKLVLTKTDVAALLRVSEATVGRMVEAGRFPRGIKPSAGTEPLWSGADLAAWLYLAGRVDESKEKAGG
jgi:hypothetical protein